MFAERDRQRTYITRSRPTLSNALKIVSVYRCSGSNVQVNWQSDVNKKLYRPTGMCHPQADIEDDMILPFDTLGVNWQTLPKLVGKSAFYPFCGVWN
eukprot:2036480-Pleurochrysis_carterae.AAC.2